MDRFFNRCAYWRGGVKIEIYYFLISVIVEKEAVDLEAGFQFCKRYSNQRGSP